MNKREVGSRYEEIAAAYLVSLGFEILEKNYRCSRGEIDLIARDGRYLVFAEVKYRADGRAGSPFEAVDAKKQSRIRRTAQWYLYSRHIREDQPCRFDVVGIQGGEIRLISDAF